MPAPLLLVRHGRSAYVHPGGWIDQHGIAAWRRAYDAAGIRPDDAPPEWLVKDAKGATHLLASDMPRALESAQRLGGGRQIDSSALLREIPIPFPRLFPRLPVAAWGASASLGLMWDIARGRGVAGDARGRVESAVLWLAGVAKEGRAVVVTHGVFRRALRDELLRRGWSVEPGPQRDQHWSAWGFAPPKAF
jgi:broad specificity phosphatase PhoE